jgi:hypothetical protein
MKRWTGLLVVVVLGIGAAGTASAAVTGRLGGQYRYASFSDDNDLRDVLAYWAGRQFHVQLEHWDFVDPETSDQFRPELGLHLRDRRKSVYTLQWRHERRQERFWFGSDQILSEHIVGRVELSPIVSTDTTLWVWTSGADYYWKSWNYLSVNLIRDPRLDGLWVAPMRVRLANEANDWVQVTFAPASRSTVGWAVDLKKRWVRLGVERNNRYDFTPVDNTILTLGFEFSFAPKE